jgi:putative flippase GtrA
MLRSISAKNQFAGFLIAGGIAAVVNFLSRIAFNLFFGYAISIVLAYLAGMVTAFLLNRHGVFAPSGKSVHVEAVWFTLVNMLAVVQTLIISLLLAEIVLPKMGILAFQKEIAHAIGIMVPVVTSYFGHKYWTFGTQARQSMQAGGDDRK